MHALYGVVCEYRNTNGSSYLFHIAIFFCVIENVKGYKLNMMK